MVRVIVMPNMRNVVAIGPVAVDDAALLGNPPARRAWGEKQARSAREARRSKKTFPQQTAVLGLTGVKLSRMGRDRYWGATCWVAQSGDGQGRRRQNGTGQWRRLHRQAVLHGRGKGLSVA